MNPVDIRNLGYSVQKNFWESPISLIREISLDVCESEIFGFVGPNGAGKSTTIRCLLGLQRPTAGTVSLFGLRPQSKEVRSQIGYLPDSLRLASHITVDESLIFHGCKVGLAASELPVILGEYYEKLDMVSYRHKRLNELSKGMAQRVRLVQAILGTKKLLVLDEPLSGLDPVGRKLVTELLMGLREKGTSIFFSSHILHDVEVLCDRVAVIDGGALKRVGRLEEIIDAYPALYQLMFSGLDISKEQLKGFTTDFESSKGVCTLRFETLDTANDCLRKLQERGALIKRLEAIRPSLEHILWTEGVGEDGRPEA
ncbi:MAG: ABC transporter ATP-binding protein [Myxococcota bacterium]|nr:ABC transporter ATP-binding protein [Myxococcota bacterium]